MPVSQDKYLNPPALELPAILISVHPLYYRKSLLPTTFKTKHLDNPQQLFFGKWQSRQLHHPRKLPIPHSNLPITQPTS